jgi:hypothetical protein
MFHVEHSGKNRPLGAGIADYVGNVPREMLLPKAASPPPWPGAWAKAGAAIAGWPLIMDIGRLHVCSTCRHLIA